MNERILVNFTPRADKHVDDAGRWWRENRTKAPEAFAQDLEQALDLISTHPYIGAVARNARLAGARRVYLARTGHYLYYRVRGMSPQSIEVVALWHSSRSRGPRL